MHCLWLTDERPPTIDCPKSEVKYVDAEYTHVTETVTAGNATAAGTKLIVTNTVSPSIYTLSKDHLYTVTNFKQEVTDDQGFKAVCLFQYFIKRKLC